MMILICAGLAECLAISSKGKIIRSDYHLSNGKIEFK